MSPVRSSLFRTSQSPRDHEWQRTTGLIWFWDFIKDNFAKLTKTSFSGSESNFNILVRFHVPDEIDDVSPSLL